MNQQTTTENNISNPYQTLNKLFFIMAIVALIIGFIRFGSFEMIDLSTEIFALFYLLFRFKTFLYDKHFFYTTDPATPRFQTVIFFEMISWSVWLLSGYFINDYVTRISLVLLSFAIMVSTICLFVLPLSKEKIKSRNYRITMNVIYFFIIMSPLFISIILPSGIFIICFPFILELLFDEELKVQATATITKNTSTNIIIFLFIFLFCDLFLYFL